MPVKPLTRWQRFVSRFLPWYDPDAQDARIRRTDDLVEQVSRIDSVRMAYAEMGGRLSERRKHPR